MADVLTSEVCFYPFYALEAFLQTHWSLIGCKDLI
jgi:hypothetical protein